MMVFCVLITTKLSAKSVAKCSGAKRGLAGCDVIKMETSIFN